MELGLKGKVAFITAASKGLGKAIAMELAKEGVELAISSRDEEQIAKTAEEIRKVTGTRVESMAADVSKPEDIQQFVHTMIERLGKVDILVLNAGGPPSGEFMQFDDETWEKAFQTNLMSVVRMVREVVPHMRKTGGGKIITIASSSVKVPIPGLVLSNTFRAGIAGLMKTLSIELAQDNILVNVVGPGRIATDRLKELDQARANKLGKSVEEVKEEIVQTIPLRRYGEPEEFAKAVVFLASDANSYITGSTVMIDGGMVQAL
ncbi:SDR family oxidoreductase [Tepidibacillus fermentans]|uniref:3-oxoacyl-[acyl-carrier protein] reductase n=1 Tax=Tepidibacillus fermentans TaxID=1281767 RepID=A0A4R3KDM0_9BACI|nr:SDR family oxidoreductase [Tepidibacillus fermentans]TCS81248.1 3-oxoacyl-[acyl-carrier protein] reductase [Tepidibacillus fermentans]